MGIYCRMLGLHWRVSHRQPLQYPTTPRPPSYTFHCRGRSALRRFGKTIHGSGVNGCKGKSRSSHSLPFDRKLQPTGAPFLSYVNIISLSRDAVRIGRERDDSNQIRALPSGGPSAPASLPRGTPRLVLPLTGTITRTGA